MVHLPFFSKVKIVQEIVALDKQIDKGAVQKHGRRQRKEQTDGQYKARVQREDRERKQNKKVRDVLERGMGDDTSGYLQKKSGHLETYRVCLVEFVINSKGDALGYIPFYLFVF